MHSLSLRDPAFVSGLAAAFDFSDAALYYKCEEAAGADLVDAVGSLDLTASGTAPTTTGKVGNARGVGVSGGGRFTDTFDRFNVGANTKSFAVFVYLPNIHPISNTTFRVGTGDIFTTGGWYMQLSGGVSGLHTASLQCKDGVTTRGVSVGNIPSNEWVSIVFGFDPAGDEIWIQHGSGARDTDNCPTSVAAAGGTDKTFIESDYSTSYFDNFAMWNRKLSQTEANALAAGLDYLA